MVNDGGDGEPVDTLVKGLHVPAQASVEVLHHEESRGMESASNAGIALAEGRYLVIHDDDDTWEPSFLETCVEYLERNRGSSLKGVVTHSTQVLERLEGDSVLEEKRRPYNPDLKHVGLVRMLTGNLYPPISFLFERQVLAEIGGYREDLPVLGDWEFNVRFLSRFDVDVIPLALANYHLRGRLPSGDYSNTVVGEVDLHSTIARRLRNEWLRQDLATGRFGVGFLAALPDLFGSGDNWLARQAVRSIQMYQFIRLLREVRKNGNNGVCVYGAGELGLQVAMLASEQNLQITRFVDSNPEKWGTIVAGIPVTSLEEAAYMGPHRYLIASIAFADEIEHTIRGYYAEHHLPKPEIHRAE